MRVGVVLSNLRNRLRAFRSETRGNVMITFALTLVPIIGFVGAAVDYSRASSAKAAMQSAVDATALFLSKEAQQLNQAGQLNSRAEAIFKAQFHRPDVTDLTVTPTLVDSGTGLFRLKLEASGIVPTTFTKVIGQTKINLSVANQVVWGVTKLEIALALDVTGSMASDDKMTKLKDAAKNLLTILQKAAKNAGDTKVAIVPFAVVVNAGAANVKADSLDWSDWMSEPAIMTTWLQNQANKNAWERLRSGDACPFTTGNHGFRCTNGPGSKSNQSTVANIPTSGTYRDLICPSMDNGSKSTTATGLLSNRYYNGCYTSTLKPDSDKWHPVKTGSSASCGGLSSSDCVCSGSGSSRVCVFRPGSNWQPIAKGSSASCGNLPSSVCECNNPSNSNDKVCRQKTYDHEWRPSPKTAWDGCVRDRNQDYDVNNAGPDFAATHVTVTNLNGQQESYRQAGSPSTANAFQPFQYATCPTTALQPLTDVFVPANFTTLVNKIEALSPSGNTNVTIGLNWAHHALTVGGPIGTAATPSVDGLLKVIILLTDGDNTQNRWTTTGDQIDTRTRLACANVKHKDGGGIELWTIKVINGNGPLLETCASHPSKYKAVENASQLNQVFEDIAKNLTKLRISM